MITQAPMNGYPPFPVCAKCQHRVEMMCWVESLFGGGTVFRAHCHGEVEETVITDAQMMELSSDSQISAGIAFQQKPALPAQGQAR